jgi:leader peptidase (prepilin peptidase)/N-methyltransferase
VELALTLAVGVLGLLVGSFLNVVIWRVPRGESVVAPGSHCPSCGRPVRARDNVPVLSWLVLRGRCRDCGARISARYPAVELLTGVLFAATARRFGLDAALPAFLYLTAVGVALAAIDLDTRRLPNALTLPSYAVLGVLLGGASLLTSDGTAMVRGLIGMVALAVLYFLLCLAGGMGLGDVKLAGVLGLALGWLGWGPLLVGTFLGFGYGAVVSIGLLVARRAGRKTRVPFGPYMVAGGLTAVLAGAELASAYTDALLG